MKYIIVHSGVGLCIVQGELQTDTTMNEGQWQGYALAHHHAICEKTVKHSPKSCMILLFTQVS